MTQDDSQDTPDAISAQLGVTLSADERSKLSRVLFPETDTHEVTVLGKVRELRPLPIKVAQRLKATIAPLNKELQAGIEAVEKNPKLDFDGETLIVQVLEKAASILADFYDWQDVKEALAKDGLALAELQGLAALQVEVSGNNDFLLDGLRSVVRWMRVAELMSVRFQSTLTGLR